jgi:hypothetical protein
VIQTVPALPPDVDAVLMAAAGATGSHASKKAKTLHEVLCVVGAACVCFLNTFQDRGIGKEGIASVGSETAEQPQQKKPQKK